MDKIAIITATRAEYGLLLPLIRQLKKYQCDTLKIEIIVTGTHLSEEYGHTVNEIVQDGIVIDEKVEIPVNSMDAIQISHNQAVTLELFSKLFDCRKYSSIVILGDRYEMLSVAIAAANTRTPIFHIAGGDTTEGAMDEWIRHAITKMSYLHFVTNEESGRRVAQLGESPDRIFNYGSLGIDNILQAVNMSKDEALQSIGLEDCKYAICTYHPVTMEGNSVDEQIEAFLEAIERRDDMVFIVTKSNADEGGARINELLDKAENEINNLHVYTSLGMKRYLNLMQYAEFVMGNSSSGLYETPSFGIPTINIGNRQRGRLQCESVINCDTDTESIIKAIAIAENGEFRKKCTTVVSPYGEGNSAEKIASKIVEVIRNGNIDLKKTFYDI